MKEISINYIGVNFDKTPDKISNSISKITSDINKLPALNILKNNKLLNFTLEITEKFMIGKDNFMVFGTGGSNLGAKALVNILQGEEKNKITFYDNIDPIGFENSIKKQNLDNIGLIFISKSGSTPETLSQLATLIEIFEQSNSLDLFYSNILIITEDKNTPLNKFAKDNKCLYLEHEENIGGRYSIFSNVGIVPAIIAGIDVKNFYAGGLLVTKFLEDSLNTNEFSESTWLFKLAHYFKYINISNKITNSIIMTYSDALFNFGKWYLQLWAESIGKENKGITAIHAVGTTDQHSQLQLYLDGPKDKFFTFITTDHSHQGLKLHSKTMQKYNINYLVDKTMGDLMFAEQRATIDTFKNNNFMFREIKLPKINEFFLGQLMAFSIIETVATCNYLNINPFNQPAVEQGKILTREYLS